MTYCGCLAEENGFTFALNYSVHGLIFFFFSLHCYSMCFILFYVSLSECLILHPSLYPPVLLQYYCNGLLNAPLCVQFIASQQMFPHYL